MDDGQEKHQQTIAELRTEVQRLKHIIHGMLAVVGLAVVCIFPQIAVAAFTIGLFILFALLVSPVRHLIFPSVFRSRKIANRQS